jgi:hypothetical protein
MTLLAGIIIALLVMFVLPVQLSALLIALILVAAVALHGR